MKDSVDVDNDENKNNLVDIGTNIKLNFLINCTPNATLKILMDEKTGDYIQLNGEGVLRATYFNKGTFDLYGNYYVDHGMYKLTIQNIIKKDFEFLSGGSIAFGGDPYNATLDLSALYVLNSVSLADLNIGNSFSNNNVRVNCLMNITGTPESPKVSFSLDMPTLSNDAKQMVYSLLTPRRRPTSRCSTCSPWDASTHRTTITTELLRSSSARHRSPCRASSAEPSASR